MLSVVSAVPVWLWIVLVNLAAVVWYATGEVKEFQCESTRATLAVRVMVVLCACVLGSLFWLATRMGEQLRRRGLAGRGPAPEPDYIMSDADHEALAGFKAHYAGKDNPFASTPEFASLMAEERAIARLRSAKMMGLR